MQTLSGLCCNCQQSVSKGSKRLFWHVAIHEYPRTVVCVRACFHTVTMAIKDRLSVCMVCGHVHSYKANMFSIPKGIVVVICEIWLKWLTISLLPVQHKWDYFTEQQCRRSMLLTNTCFHLNDYMASVCSSVRQATLLICCVKVSKWGFCKIQLQ